MDVPTKVVLGSFGLLVGLWQYVLFYFKISAYELAANSRLVTSQPNYCAALVTYLLDDRREGIRYDSDHNDNSNNQNKACWHDLLDILKQLKL